MKKHLLSLAAFLFAGSMFAQEDVDLTPAYYKFADQPVGQYKVMGVYHKATPDDAPSKIYGDHYNDGALFVAGG